MTDHIISSTVTIAMAIVGLAILAVLVSRNAQTSNVIRAASSGLAQNIAAAVAPVTGGFSGAFSPTSLDFGGFGN